MLSGLNKILISSIQQRYYFTDLQKKSSKLIEFPFELIYLSFDSILTLFLGRNFRQNLNSITQKFLKYTLCNRKWHQVRGKLSPLRMNHLKNKKITVSSSLDTLLWDILRKILQFY